MTLGWNVHFGKWNVSKRVHKNTLEKSQKSNHHIEHYSAQHTWERPKFLLKSPNQEVFLKPEHSFYILQHMQLLFIFFHSDDCQVFSVLKGTCKKGSESARAPFILRLYLIKRFDFTFHDSYNQNTVLPNEIAVCMCVKWIRIMVKHILNVNLLHKQHWQNERQGYTLPRKLENDQRSIQDVCRLWSGRIRLPRMFRKCSQGAKKPRHFLHSIFPKEKARLVSVIIYNSFHKTLFTEQCMRDQAPRRCK